LLEDPSLRKRLGTAARQHCAERYSYERMLERMETIYRQASGRS
jgi:glycosyltransferase involved in cell wall biosynthesis